VKVVPIYDRSDLIRKSIDNVTWTLVEIMITVAAVILLFLWHVPSAVIRSSPFRSPRSPRSCVPDGGVTANISCRSAASAIRGRAGGCLDRHRGADAQEARTVPGERSVGDHRAVVPRHEEEAPPASSALLVIGVSFLPVLTLEGQEGRLFTRWRTRNRCACWSPRCWRHARFRAAAAVDARPPVPVSSRVDCRAVNAVAVGRSTPRNAIRSAAARARLRARCRLVVEAPWLVVGAAVTARR